MLQVLFIIFTFNAQASQAELEFYKKREKGFHEHVSHEEKREQKVESGRKEMNKARTAHDERLQKARDNFKRVERSRQQIDEAYQAHLNKIEKRREAAQQKYAEDQKPVKKFVEEYVIPMKQKEYDIKGSQENAGRL